MSNQRKLAFISYAYAIGAIFVVLGHSTPTGESDLPILIDQIRTFIYTFHMPLFFFIAGLLFKYTNNYKVKPYGNFMKQKCIRFLTPYFVLSAIAIIPKILLSDYVNDTVAFDFQYFVKVILSPRDNVWGHFWFLPTLLLIYSISYLILKCYKYKYLYCFILLLTLVLAVFPVNINWFALNDICDQLIYFCIGIASCDFIVNKRNSFFKLPYALLLTVLSIVLFFYFNSHYYFNLDYLVNIIGVIIALSMLYAILYFSVLFEGRVKLLDYFDGKTFAIYILSWPCQAVVEILFNRILHMHWFITMPSMFCAGLFIPLLIIYIYKKFKYNSKFINLVIGLN